MNPDLELPSGEEMNRLLKEMQYVYRQRFQPINTTATVNSFAFGAGAEPLNVQIARRLEAIAYYTKMTRSQLKDVEVLDELWDNGAEVVVIRKETLDLMKLLLQEIKEANNS